MKTLALRTSCLSLMTVWFFSLQVGPAGAQPLPDAGQLRQELERRAPERPAIPPPASAPAGRAPEAAESEPSAVRVTLQRIVLEGNTLIGSDILQGTLDAYIGRPIGFAEIQRAASDVASRYRQDGWIVRTSLPPQDLQDGTLRILIVEGRFGRTVVETSSVDERLRVPMSRVLAMVAAQLQPGQPFRSADIDRTLLLLGELPGIRVQGRLSEGSADGLTDLLLQVSAEPWGSGSWGLDNQGSRATGSVRLLGSVSLASPLGRADRLNAGVMASDGNRFAQVAQQVPLGWRGTAASWNASSLEYRLTDPAVAALGARGASTSFGIDLAHPLARALQHSWSVVASAERKGFRNEAAGTITSHYHVKTARLSLDGYRSDEAGGGGVTGLNLVLTVGRVVLDGSPNEAADAQGAQTAGGYRKARLSLARQQRLTESLALNAAWSQQFAARNLDSSEKFSIGGPGGVRAYPSGEASGRVGRQVNLEMSATVQEGLRVSGFLDHGVVSGDRPRGSWVPVGAPRRELNGFGWALAWAPMPAISAKLTWSRRIAGVPADPSTTGTAKSQRLWMEIGGRF